MAVFNVAGYLIEERRRWPVIGGLLPHGDNIPNKFRILKKRHYSDEKTVPVAWLDYKV